MKGAALNALDCSMCGWSESAEKENHFCFLPVLNINVLLAIKAIFMNALILVVGWSLDNRSIHNFRLAFTQKDGSPQKNIEKHRETTTAEHRMACNRSY